MSSLISIQKSRPKRTVLPKSPIIQLFIENPSSHELVKSPTNTKTARILPKFNNQDVLKQLTLCQTQKPTTKTFENRESFKKHIPLSSAATLSPSSTKQSDQTKHLSATNTKINATQMKKIAKENKINEMARLCLNHSSKTQSNFYLNPSTNDSENFNSFLKKQNLIRNLAKEFLLDCKQRLESNDFRKLLILLNDFKMTCDNRNDLTPKSDDISEENFKITNNIHQIIKKDSILANKFSMFLTNEISLNYDLFTQSNHYEKCIEFLRKIEMLLPNKHAFKRLIQSIISCSNLDSDKISNKLEEIKTKIKLVTKNNALINIELDYLFDQRNTNLQPVYEKISLVNSESENSTAINSFLKKTEEEFIDLTEGLNLQATNNKPKKSNSKTKYVKKQLKNSKSIKSNSKTANSLVNV